MTPLNPTNATLLKEIKSMQAAITHIDGRVGILEDKSKVAEITKAAVDEYKVQEERERQNKLDDELKSKAIKIFAQLSPLIAVLGAILYAYYKTH